jgi:hypothetical protein
MFLSTAHFVNPSHESVYLPIVARQRLSGHVPAATNKKNSRITVGGVVSYAVRRSTFFDLGISWRWVVRLTLRPLYPPGNSPRCRLDRRLGGPQSRSGQRGEEKILDLTGPRTPARSQSLSRLLISDAILACNSLPRRVSAGWNLESVSHEETQ